MNTQNGMSLDSNTLKRMLKPMPSVESPVTSPEMTRRRYNYYNHHHHHHHPGMPMGGGPGMVNNNGRHSEPENNYPHHKSAMAQNSRFSGSRYVVNQIIHFTYFVLITKQILIIVLPKY